MIMKAKKKLCIPVKIVWVANLKPLKQAEYYQTRQRLKRLGEKVECIMVGAPARGATNWQCSLENAIDEIKHLTYLGARPIEEVDSVLAKPHLREHKSL